MNVPTATELCAQKGHNGRFYVYFTTHTKSVARETKKEEEARLRRPSTLRLYFGGKGQPASKVTEVRRAAVRGQAPGAQTRRGVGGGAAP